jgi:hypothetical protein
VDVCPFPFISSFLSPDCTGSSETQVPNLFNIPDKRGKYGLVHNLGLGGAVVVSLLRRPEFFEAGGEDGRTRCAFLELTLCAGLYRTLGSGIIMDRSAGQSQMWS